VFSSEDLVDKDKEGERLIQFVEGKTSSREILLE